MHMLYPIATYDTDQSTTSIYICVIYIIIVMWLGNIMLLPCAVVRQYHDIALWYNYRLLTS